MSCAIISFNLQHLELNATILRLTKLHYIDIETERFSQDI